MEIFNKNRLLTRCSFIVLVAFFSCYPSENNDFDYYDIVFKNDTNKEFKLIYQGFTDLEKKPITGDTLFFTPYSTKTMALKINSSTNEGDDFDLIIRRHVDVFHDIVNGCSAFEIYIEDRSVKVWREEDTGKQQHSPYNYDAWEAYQYQEVRNPSIGFYSYGKIVFTISNSDLGTAE